MFDKVLKDMNIKPRDNKNKSLDEQIISNYSNHDNSDDKEIKRNKCFKNVPKETLEFFKRSR